jgi:hypothetical protein
MEGWLYAVVGMRLLSASVDRVGVSHPMRDLPRMVPQRDAGDGSMHACGSRTPIAGRASIRGRSRHGTRAAKNLPWKATRTHARSRPPSRVKSSAARAECRDRPWKFSAFMRCMAERGPRRRAADGVRWTSPPRMVCRRAGGARQPPTGGRARRPVRQRIVERRSDAEVRYFRQRRASSSTAPVYWRTGGLCLWGWTPGRGRKGIGHPL